MTFLEFLQVKIVKVKINSIKGINSRLDTIRESVSWKFYKFYKKLLRNHREAKRVYERLCSDILESLYYLFTAFQIKL